MAIDGTRVLQLQLAVSVQNGAHTVFIGVGDMQIGKQGQTLSLYPVFTSSISQRYRLPPTNFPVESVWIHQISRRMTVTKIARLRSRPQTSPSPLITRQGPMATMSRQLQKIGGRRLRLERLRLTRPGSRRRRPFLVNRSPDECRCARCCACRPVPGYLGTTATQWQLCVRFVHLPIARATQMNILLGKRATHSGRDQPDHAHA